MAFNPILTGSPEERLRKLGEQFSLERVVVDALIKEKIQDLEEFRFFFDCETKVEKWLSKLSLGEEANIQAARVRRAWPSLCTTRPLNRIGQRLPLLTWTLSLMTLTFVLSNKIFGFATR